MPQTHRPPALYHAQPHRFHGRLEYQAMPGHAQAQTNRTRRRRAGRAQAERDRRGGRDYSVIHGPAGDDCCHNSIPLSDGEKTFPVPYDFDFSGLVDARYATPNPRFKIRDVTERVYRGRCDNNANLPETIAHFQAKKAEIYGLVDELVDLDKKNRQKVVRYLNSFYERISSDKAVEKYLIKKYS